MQKSIGGVWVSEYVPKTMNLDQAEEDARGFFDTLQGSKTFLLANGSARASDFEFGAQQTARIDDVDVLYFVGHGDFNGVLFGDGTRADRARMSLGRKELKFIVLDSCAALIKTQLSEWCHVFDGLHFIFGFSTPTVAEDGTRGKVFAKLLNPNSGGRCRSVGRAWERTAIETTPHAADAWAYLRAFSANSDTLRDLWGCQGPVGTKPLPGATFQIAYRTMSRQVVPAAPGEQQQIQRSSARLFKTPSPQEVDLEAWGSRFGFAANSGSKQDDYLVFEQPGMRLEVYVASNSLWWEQADSAAELLHMEQPQPVNGLTEELRREKAEETLKQRGLWKINSTKFLSHTYTQEQIIKCSENEEDENQVNEPSEGTIEQHVDFAFELDGLPVLGPGGKMRVTFRGQEVTTIFRFFREPVEDGTAPLLTSEKAEKLLRGDSSVAGLGDRLRISSPPTLGYFGFPPREEQSLLVPVYAFQGEIEVPGSEPHGFVKYVQAVDEEPLGSLPRVF